MAPMAFPGPDHSGVTLRGEAPGEYLLPHLQRVVHEGFGAIELTRIKDPAIRRRAAAIVDGLEVTFAGQVVQLQNEDRLHPYDIAHPDDGERRQAVDRLLGFLPEATALGADRFALLPGVCPVLRGDGDESTSVRHREALVSSLVELSAATEMTVVLVPFDRLPSPDGFDGAFKGALLGPVDEAIHVVELVHEAGAPNVMLGLDTAHLAQNDEGPADLLRARPLVDVVHISNCVLDVDASDAAARFGDRHPAFGVPGSVVTADLLAEYAAALAAPEFTGPVTFEIRPAPGEDPWVVLDDARRLWDAARATARP